MNIFYLGVHLPNWSRDSKIPLMLSDRLLRKYKSLWRTSCSWFLDSGGFTELSLFGKWTIGAKEYAERAQRYFYEMGNLDFVAPQDWMCEPIILDKTSKKILYHQEKTVENFLELKRIAPDIPWIPVLQGWSLEEYSHCFDLYKKYDIDLVQEKLVGLGTICRRQATKEAEEIIAYFYKQNIKLHAFGYKIRGLKNSANHLYSADSMAWSYAGRRIPFSHHQSIHKNCANCREYAEFWYDRNIRSVL